MAVSEDAAVYGAPGDPGEEVLASLVQVRRNGAELWPSKGLYGEIPKQPKLQENKQNQGQISKNKKNYIKKTGPLKTVKPF